MTCGSKTSLTQFGILTCAFAENGVIARINNDVAENVQNTQIHACCFGYGVQRQLEFVKRNEVFDFVYRHKN